MVPMRDGKQLACSLYLPSAGDGAAAKFPAILNNVNPYTRQLNDQQQHYLARHGYVVMSCDARGAKGSAAAGPFVDPFGETEQHDMYDLVEWMAKQPWSNGDVGVNGHSYGAILGLSRCRAAPAAPAHRRGRRVLREPLRGDGLPRRDPQPRRPGVAARTRQQHADLPDLAPAPALRRVLEGAGDRQQVRRAAGGPAADPRLQQLVRHLSRGRDPQLRGAARPDVADHGPERAPRHEARSRQRDPRVVRPLADEAAGRAAARRQGDELRDAAHQQRDRPRLDHPAGLAAADDRPGAAALQHRRDPRREPPTPAGA